MPRFDLEQFLDLIQEHGISQVFVVPPIALALAKHPAVDERDLSSVENVMSGAAPLGAELSDKVAKRLDCEVFQGYGMTETSPVTHMIRPGGENRPGSIGRELDDTECRIVDVESGEDAAEGERGELWIRGPQVMAGYLNNDEATQSHHRLGRLAPHRRHRRRATRTASIHRRPAEGAHQVQGLPGPAG